MLDDNKHTEVLRVMLTEREIRDLRTLARVEQRAPVELARLILRQFMYGMMERHDSSRNEQIGDE